MGWSKVVGVRSRQMGKDWAAVTPVSERTRCGCNAGAASIVEHSLLSSAPTQCQATAYEQAPGHSFCKFCNRHIYLGNGAVAKLGRTSYLCKFISFPQIRSQPQEIYSSCRA
jgi:hypothetical protein